MKIPLHYQVSNYDCGPTSLVNALSYLFEREEIPPELLRNIMLYCLDCYNLQGEEGRSGTSRLAMMYLSNWLDGYGKTGRLPISSQYVSGSDVYIGPGSKLNHALQCNGVVVVRLFLDEWHFILLTGKGDQVVLAFDPYLSTELFEEHPEISLEYDPWHYNRIIPDAC
ncbi:MAG: peptidase C39, partial [Phascolarctobacterium sp.]